MSPLSLIPAPPAGAARDDDADADLLRRIAAGDRAALEALYRPYHRRLDRFLVRLTRRTDVIEEVINDTFWIVWQKAGEFRGDSRVSTWIVGIAYRCALKALRQHGDEPVESDAHADATHSLFDPNAAHELNDWVSKGMSRLTSEQRVTLELAYGAGHSLEEIASIMECQVSTVKARMFHARVRLRNLLPVLAGRGGALADGAEETGNEKSN
jgi:RNA polymerase sigma-70 factor (ECF subfamily)